MGLNILQALHTLLGQHIQAQQGRPVAMNVSPEADQGVHSPAQAQAAVGNALPLGYQPNQGVNPYQGYVSPHPFLTQLANLSLNQRFGNTLNSMPTPANHGGALPPRMVNVAWSPNPVPYAQSLNGPPK